MEQQQQQDEKEEEEDQASAAAEGAGAQAEEQEAAAKEGGPLPESFSRIWTDVMGILFGTVKEPPESAVEKFGSVSLVK